MDAVMIVNKFAEGLKFETKNGFAPYEDAIPTDRTSVENQSP